MLSRIAILMSGAARNPVLSLNFLEMTTLDQLINFTRTSSATYVDATGKIVSTPASRNLLTFTQEFDNAAWSKSNSTITANSTAAPDGTMTADTLVEDAATATHLMSQTQTLSATPYTASVYLKAKERGFALFSQGTVNGISVNLSTGAVASAVGSPTNIASTNAGNGWWRVSFTFTPSAGSTSLNVYASTDGVWANRSYAGSTSSGIFVWGAQLEAASTATDYTRNVGGVYPPRFDYDPVTLAPKGLLIEEQRTNLFTYSEQFNNAAWAKSGASITADTSIAPSGANTADTITEDTANSGHSVETSSVSVTSGVSYTLSVYAKASSGIRGVCLRFPITAFPSSSRTAFFSIANGTVVSNEAGTTATITNIGGGWYRCALTATASATAASRAGSIILTDASNNRVYTGDGTSGLYIWGAQLEAGAFATSYIPTVASQVTRTADVATITRANFSQWYNQSEGTVFVEAVTFKPTTSATTGLAVDVSDGGINNRHYIGTVSASAEARTMVGGANQALINQAYTANAIEKYGYAYKVNDFAFFRNGSQVGTDTSGTIPTVDRMFIGNAAGSAAFWNGWLRSIRYYNTRLPNSQLQTLTAPSLAQTLSLDFINGNYNIGF